MIACHIILGSTVRPNLSDRGTFVPRAPPNPLPLVGSSVRQPPTRHRQGPRGRGNHAESYKNVHVPVLAPVDDTWLTGIP